MQVKQMIEQAKEYGKEYGMSVIIPYVKGTVLPYAKEQAEMAYLYSLEAYDTYKPLVIEKASHYYEVALATYGKYSPIVRSWVQDKYTLAKGWVLDTAIPKGVSLVVGVTVWALAFINTYIDGQIEVSMESAEGPTESVKDVLVLLTQVLIRDIKKALVGGLEAMQEVIFPELVME